MRWTIRTIPIDQIPGDDDDLDKTSTHDRGLTAAGHPGDLQLPGDQHRQRDPDHRTGHGERSRR